MKVVFLDFDGVLNNYPFINAEESLNRVLPVREWEKAQFDPININNINRVIESIADIKFVISSSWRYGMTVFKLKTLLKSVGFLGNIIDRTSTDQKYYKDVPCRRDRQIFDWVDEHSEVSQFVVVDDSNLFESYEESVRESIFLRTDPNVGFSDVDSIRLISMLS